MNTRAAKHLRKWIALLCFCLRCSPANAAPESETPGLKDFVHARELKAEVEGVLYRVTIPDFVYGGLIRSQNRDLAVFNASGDIVPFVVRPARRAAPLPRRELSVPFFELPPDGRASVSGAVPVDIYVRTGAAGQIVEIKGKPIIGGGERRYLLDFSSFGLPEDAEARRLELVLLEGARLNARLSLFEGDNLRDWNPIVREVPLIRLENRDSRLSSDGIDLRGAPARYLLLHVEGADSFELRDVRYSFAPRGESITDALSAFEGRSTADRRAVEYDTGGAYPASSVQFALREPGFYSVRISSRSDANAPWRPVGGMELFMILETPAQGAAARTNPPTAAGGREDRYWRLDFDTPFSGTPPEMHIARRPSEICFLAQGKAPYILAFGSPREMHLQNNSFLSNIDARNATPAEAEIGAPLDPAGILSPGGESAALPRFDGIEWQRRLVWALLVLGALLLSGMAWKLMRNEK